MLNEIDCSAENVRTILHNNKYELDYYQREYSWQTKQVTELIHDLIGKFNNNFKLEHDMRKVYDYDPYFLGSIIINKKESQRNIIDGQQRLTTLTLLLIHLRHLLKDDDQKTQLANLIYSGSFVDKSFNLNIPDRDPIMNALYNGEPFDAKNESASIRNIITCYDDIKKFTEPELSEQELPYFSFWVLERVYFAEIIVNSDEDAYTIFETMNDRGIPLTPTDMLKGFLLSKIADTEKRNSARKVWDDKIQKLKEYGKDEESEAIKAWLRSQFANTVRDYEGIGAKFHRWVRDKENKEKLGLSTSDSCANFIEEDFEFYSSWYSRLRDAATSLTPGLECIYYNAQNNFALQYTLLLSPLRVGDTEEDALRKIHIVSTYLDIFINRRIWNGDSIARNNMDNYIWREQQVTNEYKLSSIIPLIRGKSSEELMEILYKRIQAETKPFENKMLHLHVQNRRKIHLILARMTDYIETKSKMPSHYHEYIKRKGINSYEIEHIWANKYEMYREEFSHQYEFEAYRDRIGGLLLLPKINNASYGDLTYKEKREHYLQENLLAQSLHEIAYENKTGFSGFKQFIEWSKLPFQPYSEFKKTDIDARQKLYQLIAKNIWNPELLKLPFSDEPEPIVIEDEKDETDFFSPEGEHITWSAEQISRLIPPERKEFYIKEHSSQKMHECYSKLAELQNLIQERNWSLNLEFRNYYCAFYSGNRCVFGINLYSSPRFAVWVAEAEAESESLKSRITIANYSKSLGHAVYPRNTSLENLLPILEFAYKKHRAY